MSKAGQDCYFFFYSSCSKGDSCPFRHCEAAIGNETVCTLWQEGRCFRQVCKFRHMEIDKKRSEIPCYWENQLSGCQKANCAFHHTKGRFVDGIFFPPSKTAVSWPEPAVDEVKGIQPSLQQDKLSGLPNTSPQLRGVIKVDHENVPSPTHPPVIINAADDDDDAGGSINVGIRSMRQSKPKNLTEHANPLGSGTSPSVCTAAVPKQGLPKIEKNIRSVMRTVTLSSNPDEEPRFGLTLSERLEKRKNPFTEALSDEVTGPALKRSLAERLGRKIKSSELSVNEAQKKVHFPRSIKERLGFPSDQSNTETDIAHSPGEIYIKTLEEIRLEKLIQKKQEQDACPKVDGVVGMEDLVKRAQSCIHVKSFIEVLAEKKLRQTEEAERHRVKTESSEMVNNTGNDSQGLAVQVNLKSDDNNVQTVEAAQKRRSIERVRVKTLEEIRREKALRLRKSGESARNGASQAEPATRGRRLLLSNKPAGGKDDKLKVEMSVPAALQASAGGDALQECVELGASDTSPKVLVKSFEEIMREKRRRKQQETAVQLLKEHTQLSVLEGGAPKENFEESLSTSAKDSATTLRMQQVRPQRSLQGKTPNQLPGMQQISSPLQGLQTSPVRSMQPLRTKSRLQVSSPAKSQEPSSPVKLQEQSLLGKSQEPSSSMNFNQPLSPVKTDHPSSLVKPHQPSSLGKSLPDKHKQLSLLVKPQQPSSPVKPIQPSSQLKAQQPLSPMKPQKPSSPVTFQQPSSPVHAHQLSLLVRPQQPSSPVRSPQSTSPTIAQQSCSPVSSSQHLPLVLKDVKGDKPSLPDKLDQRALSVHVEQPSTSLSVQQPSQDESKQSSTVRSKDLSPVRQLETLTGLQETTDVMSSEEGFSSADAPADKAAKSKGKPKASVKPSVGRKQVPVKGPQKRKGGKSKPTAVAAVKPMSPSFPTDEPPAKKAAQAVGDTSDPVTEQEKTTGAGAEASDDSAASLEAMQAVPNPATELASPTPSPASVKTRRSSSSAPKTPLPAEDDFEKLMWELSGGRMEEEAEIDLDAGKDEDDLLLELSEMIDS
ncbi:zinc finger CCCH domain-containing protein 11A-like isoform X2 [Pleurodeles waltl]|uniref:zinc finger CCCH domain-containing protein 11A-like isoform X2 n=1 Tax=Pleurodeles waltl TaxID=8319 RepID=UPI0037099286